MQNKKWKLEEIEFLINNNRKLSLLEFSEKLNRTERAIKLKINRLGFSVSLENKSTSNCLNCEKEIKDYTKNDRKFCCHSCSASYMNKIIIKKNALPIINCGNCGKPTKNKEFCSPRCSHISVSKKAYSDFLNGINQSTKNNYSPKTFKKFFLEEQDNKCAVCSMKNEWNGKSIVFVMDHIDGNSTNNNRNNLRLVCPNCDSQLDTYKSKNKNSGRFYRRQRILEGKSY